MKTYALIARSYRHMVIEVTVIYTAKIKIDCVGMQLYPVNSGQIRYTTSLQDKADNEMTEICSETKGIIKLYILAIGSIYLALHRMSWPYHIQYTP